MPDNTKQMRRRSFLKLAGAGAASISVAGCTGGGGETTPTESEAPPTTEAPDDGDGTATDTGDTLDIGNNTLTHAVLGDKLGSIDPHKVNDDVTQVVGLTLYDPLISVDSDGVPIAHLATDWRTEDDGNTWVLDLRDDVTFHSGNQLTAEDVAYSADRWRSFNQGYASFWAGYISPGDTRAVDDHTVAFDIGRPFGPLLATMVMFKVVDSELVKENEADGEHGDRGDFGAGYLSENDAGSGPYKLAAFAEGDQIDFQYFPDYWRGWEERQFGQAGIKFIPEEATVRQLMSQGEADITDQYLSPSAYGELENSDNVQVVRRAQPQIYEIMMNCQKKPLDDVQVRKAIALAFDYETALNDIWPTADPCPGPVPKVMFGHNDNIEPPSQDLEAAKEALSKSKYSLDEINSIELELSWINIVDLERRLSLLLKQNMEEIGITNVSIKGMPWATWTGLVGDPQDTPHFSNFFHSADIPTPDNFTFKKYHPDAAGSIVSASWFNSQSVFEQSGVGELSSVLDDARTTMEQAARIEKYKQAQELIMEGYPSVFVSNPEYKLALSNRVEGWKYFGGILGFPRTFYPLKLKE